MNSMTIRFWLFLSVLLCAYPARGAELTRVRVASLITGEFSQAYIAQNKGFFEKYGLAVERFISKADLRLFKPCWGGISR